MSLNLSAYDHRDDHPYVASSTVGVFNAEVTTTIIDAHCTTPHMADMPPNQTITIDPHELAAYQWLMLDRAISVVNVYTRAYLSFVAKHFV